MVEMRKRLLTQIRAHQKSGTAELFQELDAELKDRLDGMIAELEAGSQACWNVMIVCLKPPASFAPYPVSARWPVQL
ncbi:hypothetical protein SAMN04488020_12311 [Palleronia marisminoris]|uniref:Uncharacterized protein n=1 Tax=Palleronia marisminoris TaxID=315423 RepID=A0A1Y5TUB8_9RHOB|nr:hypothetical protein [Palleronia marisminoris]SFH54747.1 hypothetical protein SAMN04488020_12311 [Palleronia marisminoris]SLN71943.1 hypothetical protein PAM7066_03699 [Palleronia marisminoris]